MRHYTTVVNDVLIERNLVAIQVAQSKNCIKIKSSNSMQYFDCATFFAMEHGSLFGALDILWA